MRIAALIVACVVLSAGVSRAQEPSPIIAELNKQVVTLMEKDAAKQKRIEELEAQLKAVAAKAQSPAERLKERQDQRLGVFSQGKLFGKEACKKAGGKKFIVTIDAAGNQGSACEF